MKCRLEDAIFKHVERSNYFVNIVTFIETNFTSADVSVNNNSTSGLFVYRRGTFLTFNFVTASLKRIYYLRLNDAG